MDSEFLLGDDILVAPVLEEGATLRKLIQQQNNMSCMYSILNLQDGSRGKHNQQE